MSANTHATPMTWLQEPVNQLRPCVRYLLLLLEPPLEKEEKEKSQRSRFLAWSRT